MKKYIIFRKFYLIKYAFKLNGPYYSIFLSGHLTENLVEHLYVNIENIIKFIIDIFTYNEFN